MWGIHPVEEILTRRPGLVEEMLVATSKPVSRVADLGGRARREGINVRDCGVGVLDGLSRGGKHQGVAVRMGPFPYASLDVILESPRGVVVALDCIQDPRNLGAVLRTAHAVGARGVLVPTDRSAEVTGAAVRSAGGYVYGVPIARVTNLARAIESFTAAGWWAVGLVPGARVLYEVTLPERVLLVIGGEGRGIRPLVCRACDELVSLPMAAGIDSLNAAVAAGCALYELRRRGLSG